MVIEIVSFPIKKMVIFHSYVNVYQRVDEENLNGIYHGDIFYIIPGPMIISCSIIIPVYHIVDHWFAEDLTNEARGRGWMIDENSLVCWNHQQLYDFDI